jgi:hypothetical protein
VEERTTVTEKPVSTPFGPHPRSAVDLSREIEQSLDRQPDERVRTVRLFGDCYRCNWWVEDKTPHPFWLATGTIRKSRFLRATKSNDQLLIEDFGSRSNQ